MAAVLLLLTLQTGVAQKKPAVGSPDEARRVLVEKARALEARGRPDMAIQLWQQILLSEPGNTEALAGLARDYKLIGSAEQSAAALDRLRKINPNDPNIGKIGSLTSTRMQSDRLRQAGDLARAGKMDDAMKIYRDLYGDHPPDGDIALAYYQTLYGTNTGKEAAVAAMRALAARNPGDTRFDIELGTMLTYDARTRTEGIRVLNKYPKDSNAQTALRQALIWDSANPSSAAQLRDYLKGHPQDAEIAKHLQENETKLAQMNSGIARTPEEKAAFAALNAHKLDEAQTRFAAILAKEPENGRAAAGLGFLRMQQNNFGGAISYLTQAEQNGYRDRAVEAGLATSRFWYIMGEASQAFDEGQMDVALAKYKAALAMRPRSPEALNGLAGLYVKQQQYADAIDVYTDLTRVQPSSAAAWRGLFLAYARSGENKKALETSNRFPASVKAANAKDPEYLRTLATIYHAEGRTADAQRVLALALSLPFPENGATLKADTRLQYAGVLMEAQRYDQAAELYNQILLEDPANLSAWMGLVSAHHELAQDTQAIADVEKMPPATYDAALADPGFLSMLGSIYQQANQFDIAQGLLERSAKLQTAAGGAPAIPLQLQLAAIYLQRNNTDQAYAIYHDILQAHPDRVDAWKGLIASLQATNRNTEALQQIAVIPAGVRKQLETDIDFVQGEASLYASTGDVAHATEYMNLVLSHYRDTRSLPPASIDVQNAWLLFNTGNDRALYPALMRLGGRQDLTATQREAVQSIWAAWSVRRANAAMENGNMARAIEILDAAAQAFPDNITVRKAVAGGYARVGRAKEALTLFKTIPMQDAAAGDFQGAIGAALAANDKSQAELWLRQALDRYPQSPAILALAARFEQARGDTQRAADYWRASLAAMPRATPADRLAHTLVYPDQDNKTRRAATPADLQHLLDPNYEPFAKTAKLAPLPAYGADPYGGRAPVDLSRPSTQPSPWAAAPAAAQPVAPAPVVEVATQPVIEQPAAASRRNSNPAMMGAMHLPASAQAVASPQLAAQPAATPQPTLAQSLNPDRAAATPDLAAAAPHSLAADSWKGLFFSLLAGHRYDEAFQQLNQIPPDLRHELDGDVEFVQGEASLYAATGDVPHATEFMRRVEDYYLVRHASAPASIEVQNAWLQYNTGDDHRLYSSLRNLDARRDLTDDQREQVQNIWASWSQRRALAAMQAGNPQLAVDILEAAAWNYPNNPGVRRALAGAYLRAGRVSDSLALFKSLPMQEANSGEFQGAIGAALAAKDTAQAEAWLRLALGRYPKDAGVLAAAARFEQAEGNNQRATEYWRASLAAMPPGAKAPSFLSQPDYPQADTGPRPASAPGDLKRLLDPDNRILPGAQTPAALPGSTPNTHSSSALPFGQQILLRSAPVYLVQHDSSGAMRDPFYIPLTRERTAVAFRRVVYGQQAPGSAPQPAYAGQVLLPASEESVGSVDSAAPARKAAPAPLYKPAPAAPQKGAGLRITSQPMGALAARVQALFAEQTDGQLTQGSTANLRAPLLTPAAPAATAAAAAPPAPVRYTMAQYTPSAQEAATGAYSAQKQQQAQPVAQPVVQPAAQPANPPTPRVKRSRKTRKAEAAAARQTATPTLAQVPATPPAQQIELPSAPVVDQTGAQAPATTGAGLTDEELQQRNLPPLRGPWVRVQREQRQINPRDEAETQLRSIESGYSPWLGGAGLLNYRSGDLGYDHLSALEAPFEVSMPLGYGGRLTFIGRPVFLDSGQADGTSVIQVLKAVSPGSPLVLTIIPQPIGTLTATDTNPPAQQNASGIGGEAQLAFPHLAIAGGYTPANFLVSTFTARAMWRPGNGPFTFRFDRDPIKDTQLSYAGLRDPAGNTLGNAGQVWGGMVANQGSAQYVRGDEQSGFYIGVGGQYITGYKVRDNSRIDGNGGAYWRLKTIPEYGNLSVGANFFGMHYGRNQDAFTLGMGGYFSPQAYFLANAPITWSGHYNTNWHYNVMGSLGVQAFQVDKTALFPNNAITEYIPSKTSVGPNYDLRGSVAYQISPHWFAGGAFGANNSRNYSSYSAGFFVRYLFRSQPSTVAGPTGLFPNDGLRPFTVP
ncbi:MAG: cellulose synthase subunit BcsC-related outer membrane protein [Terracidiphilus sp.]